MSAVRYLRTDLNFGCEIPSLSQLLPFSFVVCILWAHFSFVIVFPFFLSSKTKNGPSTPSAARGIVYIGHIPWGFFESNMRDFFSQFGDIQNMKLSRSKSGRSKGYAFVEFESLETAQIVGETMNGYMMFGRTLRAHVLEARAIHADLFKGTDKPFRVMPGGAIAAQAQNAARTYSAEVKRLERLKKNEESKRNKLAEMGINYAFPGYAADKAAEPTKPVVVKQQKQQQKKKQNASSKKKNKSSSKKKAAVPAASSDKKKAPAAKSPATSNKKEKAAPAAAKAAAPKEEK